MSGCCKRPLTLRCIALLRCLEGCASRGMFNPFEASILGLEHCVFSWNQYPIPRHSLERGNPDSQPARSWKVWIPAFAGMTGDLI
jgi:hypothetical protein